MAMPTRQNDEPSPEPARQEVKQVDDWRRKLHWSASGHGWFAITEEGTLFVSEETYERHMKAYLASEGHHVESLDGDHAPGARGMATAVRSRRPLTS